VSVVPKFVGPQRKALLKLFAGLDDLSLGVGQFAPGCDLDEEEGLRLDMAKAVVRSLIDATVPAGEVSKAGGLAPRPAGE
jgi:hypothetical protein